MFIIRLAVLIASIRLLMVMQKPVTIALIYTLLYFLLGIAAIMAGEWTLMNLISATAIRFGISLFYFWLLNITSDSFWWWLLLPLGIFIV